MLRCSLFLFVAIVFLVSRQEIRTGRLDGDDRRQSFISVRKPFGTPLDLAELSKYSGCWQEVAEFKHQWGEAPVIEDPGINSLEDSFGPDPDESIHLCRISNVKGSTELSLGVVDWDTMNERYKVDTYRVVVRSQKKSVVFFFAVPDQKNVFVMALGKWNKQGTIQVFLPEPSALEKLIGFDRRRGLMLREQDVDLISRLSERDFKSLFEAEPKYKLQELDRQ